MILLFGADGLLGSWVYAKHPKDVIPMTRNDVDICDSYAIEKAIVEHQPDAVINCAGMVKNYPPLFVYQMEEVNSAAPLEVASICDQLGVRLIHISTDCVFKGDRGGYIESDLPDAEDNYGWYKAQGEVSHEPHLTVRTSFVGWPDPKGRGLLAWLNSSRQPEIQGYYNVRWNGLTTWTLADMLVELAYGRQTGIMHLHGQTVSKHDLLVMANSAYGWGKHIIPVEEPVIDRTLHSMRMDRPVAFGGGDLGEALFNMSGWEKKWRKVYEGTW